MLTLRLVSTSSSYMMLQGLQTVYDKYPLKRYTNVVRVLANGYTMYECPCVHLASQDFCLTLPLFSSV
jgi:hypothetical protein